MVQLEEEQIGDVLVIRPLDSRLELHSASDFMEEVGRRLEKGPGRVVLNLSRLTRIDSSGLGALVSFLRLVEDPAQLAIAEAQPTVLSLFRLTRMDTVFQLFATETEAIAALTRNPA